MGRNKILKKKKSRVEENRCSVWVALWERAMRGWFFLGKPQSTELKLEARVVAEWNKL